MKSFEEKIQRHDHLILGITLLFAQLVHERRCTGVVAFRKRQEFVTGEVGIDNTPTYPKESTKKGQFLI